MPKANRTRGSARNKKKNSSAPALDIRSIKRRRHDVIDQCLQEIDNLPINQTTGRIFRGSMKKICDEYMANNAWLTLDSIHSKQKRNNKQNELRVVPVLGGVFRDTSGLYCGTEKYYFSIVLSTSSTYVVYLN